MEHGFIFRVDTKDLRKAAFAIAFGATMGKFVGNFCITVLCKFSETCADKLNNTSSCTKNGSKKSEE